MITLAVHKSLIYDKFLDLSSKHLFSMNVKSDAKRVMVGFLDDARPLQIVARRKLWDAAAAAAAGVVLKEVAF